MDQPRDGRPIVTVRIDSCRNSHRLPPVSRGGVYERKIHLSVGSAARRHRSCQWLRSLAAGTASRFAALYGCLEPEASAAATLLEHPQLPCVEADRLTFYRRSGPKPSYALDLVAIIGERLAQVVSDDRFPDLEDTVVGKKADSDPLSVPPRNQEVAAVFLSGSSQGTAQTG